MNTQPIIATAMHVLLLIGLVEAWDYDLSLKAVAACVGPAGSRPDERKLYVQTAQDKLKIHRPPNTSALVAEWFHSAGLPCSWVYHSPNPLPVNQLLEIGECSWNQSVSVGCMLHALGL